MHSLEKFILNKKKKTYERRFFTNEFDGIPWIDILVCIFYSSGILTIKINRNKKGSCLHKHFCRLIVSDNIQRI